MSLFDFFLILGIVYMVTWLVIAVALGVLVFRYVRMAREISEQIKSGVYDAKSIWRKLRVPVLVSSPILLPLLGMLWKLMRKKRF